MNRIVAFALALACFAPPAAAQQQGGAVQTVELRVAAQRPRGVLVDRGSSDGLAIGDRVRFRLRGGGTVDGRVSEVGERNALVLLDDPKAQVELGARGEAAIPSSRVAAEVERIEPAPEVEETAPEFEEHPPWERADDEFQADEPLLARVVPLRPAERTPSWRGRLWTSADEYTSSEDERTDGYERIGASLFGDNQLGHGERIALDFEVNARRTDLPPDPADQDVDATRLRVDRASYTLGDSRFSTDRVEFGRFLQRGMPEFGVVDGAEWGRRLDGGNRFGASVGWMPEPDEDYESGHDFQVAGYYRWVFDDSELASASLGAQKTFHHADADRDLLVAKVEYLPLEGWQAAATAWVDYYTSGDDAKGPGFDVSQLYARAWRRFSGGDSLAFTATHLSIPEIDRHEVPPLSAAALADDRHERVAAEWEHRFDDEFSLAFEGGLWTDEEESGTDGELGLTKREFWCDGGRGELALFGTRGRFSRTYGARARFARDDAYGAWRADYEFAQNLIDGFASDNNELPQHRLRCGRDGHFGDGWSFACDVEAFFWDQETAFALHVFLQRSF
ncbi:MAG: hypothetical protein L6Q99_14095 [Planctomycetes bacterium]|nr:hypothetical protein [Planctomycetota bacterium]